MLQYLMHTEVMMDCFLLKANLRSLLKCKANTQYYYRIITEVEIKMYIWSVNVRVYHMCLLQGPIKSGLCSQKSLFSDYHVLPG